MASFKYSYSDPNQVIKITFPFAGIVHFAISGGAGGGGGPDTASGQRGLNTVLTRGRFTVPAPNYTIVLQAGGAGKGGGWTGNGGSGGAGGEGILKGGNGGNGGPQGTSGHGGGGGAASFIMEFSEYQKLVNKDYSSIIPLVVAYGSGGGAGNGRYGGGGYNTVYNLRQELTYIDALYGENGRNHPGDGGGGGGGGGGWKYISNGKLSGGGVGGNCGSGDATGQAGAWGSNYFNSNVIVVTSSVDPLSGGAPSSNGKDGYVEIEYIPDNQDTSEIYTKRRAGPFSSLIFRKVPEIYVRANNNTVWQQVKDVYVKNNGSWVNVFHVVDEQQFAPTLENINPIVKGPLNKGSDLGWVWVETWEWSYGEAWPPSYGTLLNAYGIAKTSIRTLGANEFTTTVFIPTAGNYRMYVASDNSGYCVINCKRGTSSDSYNTWPGYKEYIVNLPKGEVYLTAGYNNLGGPGGIAVLLTTMSGSRVWDTRSWRAGTYSFKYNNTEAGIIGTPVCGTITNLTAEPPPPEPPPPDYGGSG